MAFVPPPYPARPTRPGARGRRRGARRHPRRLGRHAGRPDARGRCSTRSSQAAPGATGYPATIGSPASARPRPRLDRAPVRLHGRPPTTWSRASAPRSSSPRCRACCRSATRSRDTVLYPAVAYPTYEMGALLAGLRAVPVPVDDEWHLDLDRVDPADADRALVLWLNDPEQPHRRGRVAAGDARRGRVGARTGDRRRQRRVLRRVHLRRRRRARGAGHRAERRGRRRARRPLALEALEHGRAAGRVRRRRPRRSSATSARCASTAGS